MNLTKGSLTMFVFFLFSQSCTSTDTIIPTQHFKDGDVLISSGQKFTLGFFSPGNSTRRYLGIWYYKVPEQTVVWVANRDSPVNDTSGILSFNSQGNLVLYGQNETFPVWSTNVSSTSSISNSGTAQLLDSGNLVLVHQDSQTVLWQSFDYPTDTFLPSMKLGMDRKSGFYWFLTSWKSKNDPGTGNVSLRFDPTGYPQLFMYEGQVRWWRAGPWNGQRMSGIPEMTGNYIFRVGFVDNEEQFYMYHNMTNPSMISRLKVEESGTVARFTWSGENRQWVEFWSDPREQCDYYGVCGPNSNCDPYEVDTFMCKCLPGFEPKSPSNWFLRDGLAGCIRNAGVSTCRSGEGFVKLERVRVPDTRTARVNMSMTLKACEEECLRNCSCNAYTSADVIRGFGCLAWYGDLLDIRTYSGVGQDIYVRVDAAEFASYGKSKGPLANHGVRAIVIVSVAVALFLIVFLIFWLVRRKRKAEERSRQFSFDIRHISSSSTHRSNPPNTKAPDERGSSDLPLFDLSAIVAATNNFSTANKLGEGGFGSVYKVSSLTALTDLEGMLDGGEDIAVKRLSKNSGQGIDEFRNEVTLIAKLQHRNLVRILGYCIQDQEKMLIYEYSPNKSLDSIIFDKKKSAQLDWPMRYNIICGIARGILYLHQDSRLRIIHRDLKASNVLLDASMNPKISDFGMARIFGVDQIEANTRRIVGTYGYMSPEYAMHGIFSVKSDVYSFGILLIEIISGKKNSNFYDKISSSNLVGYVWELWKEGRAVEIVDGTVGESYPTKEVLRCIHIGLLCVQESAKDRPTMSAVVFMLSNDTALPSPRQPAFILKETSDGGDRSTSGGAVSLNDVTITLLDAR